MDYIDCYTSGAFDLKVFDNVSLIWSTMKDDFAWFSIHPNRMPRESDCGCYRLTGRRRPHAIARTP
ncbi:hypothetical protein LCGC14_1016320 [marine sediment metagenome]|uniref:Uncharacterized protein n=1 Tax=marine sediment metagenome TaxID=412755 RepID=A0A0F9N3C2_9ZZZZ